MDLLKLPNVSTNASANDIAKWYSEAQEYLGVATLEEAKAQVQVLGENDTLTELVRQAVVNWPEWQFRLRLNSSLSRRERQYGEATFKSVSMLFHKVEISSAEGIPIGAIYSDGRWKRSGVQEKIVKLHNARIAKARDRKSTFDTKDVKAALREMKKTFYAPTAAEVMSEASEKAHAVLRNALNLRGHNAGQVRNRLSLSAIDYISANDERRDAFGHWCRVANRVSGSDVVQMLNNYRDEQRHYSTIEEVQKAFNTHKTVLVVKSQNGYILQLDSELKLCDDLTLPDNLRSKLGMLKLVDKSQVIENVGCRVNDETFVIVLDAEQPQP